MSREQAGEPVSVTVKEAILNRIVTAEPSLVCVCATRMITHYFLPNAYLNWYFCSCPRQALGRTSY